MVAPQRAGAVDTASSNSSDDTVAFRRWSRCIFQSQAGDPVDRAVLLLMGGSAEWREESCTRWDETACACAAPLSLLGPAHTFVEVGAHDGLHMAATHFFENYLGWRGLCVEAGPAFYAQLAHTRPGCTRVNAVVGRPQDWGNRSTVPFISFSRKEGHAELGRKDWELGLSGPEGSSERTRTLASAESWARHVSKYRKPALFASRAWLPVRPFASIFAAHRVTRVDLLVVDVEGAELGVLQSIDFERVAISLVAVEGSGLEWLTKGRGRHIDAHLQRRGFRRVGLMTLMDSFWLHRRHGRRWGRNKWAASERRAQGRWAAEPA